MLKVILAASFVALLAASPLSATAQTSAMPGVHRHHAHQPTGSHRSEMRKRHNTSKDRARASAEHMRTRHVQ